MIIEAAMLMPFFLAIVVGAVETARYVTIHQKMERATVTLSDLVSRSPGLTEAQIQDIFFATTTIMSPYSMTTDGRVVISSVTKPVGNPARVTWQRSGSGNLGVTSRVGVTNGNASLPAGFTLQDNESVVIAEIFYDYEPMFLNSEFVADRLYERALFRPRLSGSVALN